MRLLLPIALFLLSNPAFAAGGSYLSQSINTVLLILLLVVLGRKPILKTLSKRSSDIAYDIKEAQDTLSQAENESLSVQKKLDSLEQQINEIKDEARKEAEAIKVDLARQAEDELVRIRKSAESNIEGALQIARNEIRKEAAANAIDLAEKQLKTQIQKSDQKRLSQEFIVGFNTDNHSRNSL